MSNTVKLAEYLFTRLRQLDVRAIHGVPGDYNLNLLDYVEPMGLLWVGNANELNAGYAADGYARIKGIGALITTYGVGELSAINAIAGAYTERAAVVHIVGTPSRSTQDSRMLVHHTLGDGEYRHFSQMYSHVTVAQTNLLDPRTCAEQIDHVLKQCILHSRPVYIEVPEDMVTVPVSATNLTLSIGIPEIIMSPAHDEILRKILDKMYAAKLPVILVDGDTRALNIQDDVQHLIEKTKWPTFTSISGNGLIDTTLANVHGIYRGKYAEERVKRLFDSADLILCFGPHFSSTNTYNWSAVPKTLAILSFTHTSIEIAGEVFRDIPCKFALSQLLQKLDITRIMINAEDLGILRKETFSLSDISAAASLRQDILWRFLAGYIREGDIVLGETGTAGHGIREMPLPRHPRLFGPMTWLSIGYMLPAAQGAAMAQRELIAENKYKGRDSSQAILMIGDGSFQMTVQELGTMIRHNLNIVIFLINNNGYTIERCIHGVNQQYNDISCWRYSQALQFMGAHKDAYTKSARTYGELKEILSNDHLISGKGVRLVELLLEIDDAPPGPLLDMLNQQKLANK